jgi:hypothetical protein
MLIMNGPYTLIKNATLKSCVINTGQRSVPSENAQGFFFFSFLRNTMETFTALNSRGMVWVSVSLSCQACQVLRPNVT